MTLSRHPSPELMARYVAGTLSPAAALVVESHLALCDDCTATQRDMLALGGLLLEDLPPSDLDARLFERTLARLGEKRPAAAPAPAGRPVRDLGIYLPAPIADRATSGWRWMGPGMAFARLDVPEDPATNLILLKIAAGKRMPTHGHSGEELTLVLQGAFEDEHGRCAAGDLAEEDDDTHHTPVVTGEETCICLASIEGRLRPHGLIGRLVSPLIGL
ncbi:transcriptional regulator [Pleomorphomonas diazotrophica]|uniref:Transcriptional regulator n=1 Tax=Pleomorphomonas diazotrophica TaxID=1166257 RepID=A0A1I4UU37_9HYPH|nr:ChrR family anti-sigma-E factor [Pleomorphomonas diazotrophica]PKR89823.1 transcriptional regulator [Pleomorphomonas diazotrophica]SFM92461.1 anti-ECFsigma factor, ChrR [Pleomorphomonas diazotrophica]